VLPASSFQHTEKKLIEQPNNLTTTTSSSPPPPASPPQAPDFKQVRRYLRTVQQREALGQFIRAGWTPAELAEFARDTFLAPGKTYPTAASYRYAMNLLRIDGHL
jgi:hypothetical protein